MPAEKEQKFILSFTMRPEDLARAGWKKLNIEQAYLPKRPRPAVQNNDGQYSLRHTFTSKRGNTTTTVVDISKDDYDDFLSDAPEKSPRIRRSNNDYSFTFKFWVASKGRDTEIEGDITKEAYDNLYKSCKKVVTKDRYVCPNNDSSNYKWTVDFLKDDKNEIYIVMAEVEMPENVDAPSHIPAMLRPYIRHAVPLQDRTFSNKKLSDVNYAQDKLKELGIVKHPDTKGHKQRGYYSAPLFADAFA